MEEIYKEAEELFKEDDKLDKFFLTYHVYPTKKVQEICKRMKSLAEQISDHGSPQTEEEVKLAELKRRLRSRTYTYDNYLAGTTLDYDKTIELYAIPQEDIESLRPWLDENKEAALEAMYHLYEIRDLKSYHLQLQLDIPSQRRQAEEFAGVQISKYHKSLGRMLQEFTQVGEFLREINAETTTKQRSYFDMLKNMLALSMGVICRTTEDGIVRLNEKEIITLYGHEGMGHALNNLITNRSGLPLFLKKGDMVTSPTAESVAQFYERQIFEDLKESRETQRELDIAHCFEEINDEVKSTELLDQYRRKLQQYIITVLADKEMERKDKINRIDEVALQPGQGRNQVEAAIARNLYDTEGNLNPNLVRELRYCAQPVSRAIKEFESQGITYKGEGRSTIDETLLTGFWTPIGYVQNAKVQAISESRLS